MPRHAPVFSLQELLLTEAVKDLEAATPLQDDRAMRTAAATSSQRERRIVQRALTSPPTRASMATPPGCAGYCQRWAWWWWLRALFAALVTMSLLGDGRASTRWPRWRCWCCPTSQASWPGRCSPRCRAAVAPVRSATRRPRLGRRGPWQRRARVVPAALRLLDACRLAPWLLGGLNHLLWAVAYLLAALGLVAVLSLAEYRLGFETTILSPQTLYGWARAIAWLPIQLGLPARVPDPADAAGASHALGWWLISGTLAYGALPRLLLLALCAAVARSRTGAR
jgi:hypothetical protein